MKPENLQENLIDLHWDQAVELGVPGHSTQESWAVSTDPEALTVLVGIVSDARLEREWIGWLKKFGSYVYTNRLKKIIEDLYESMDHRSIDPHIQTVKSILLRVQEESNHTFQPVIDFLKGKEVDRDLLDKGQNPKITMIDETAIVENEPKLYWRHIAGVNARAELLSSVDEGWRGNSHRGSSELYLPQTSIQRAVQNLQPTGMIDVKKVDNSKVISKGARFTAPYEHSREYFIHWGNWIEAVIQIKNMIDKNLEKTFTENLENRFTDSIHSILDEDVLRPAFTHRHGEMPSKTLINRVLDEVSLKKRS
jgi:predicted transcriptional regulator